MILEDKQSDIVLMKAKFNIDAAIPINKSNASLLEDVYVAGYPFGNYISTSVKVTRGIVSSLSGVADNYSNFQIDALKLNIRLLI